METLDEVGGVLQVARGELVNEGLLKQQMEVVRAYIAGKNILHYLGQLLEVDPPLVELFLYVLFELLVEAEARFVDVSGLAQVLCNF